MFDQFMNDDPSEDDFLPPDVERVDYVLGLTVDLYTVLSTAELSIEQQRAIVLASTNLKILLAQAISGWTLYNEEAKYADRLRDLSGELYNHIVMNQPEMIDSFKDIDVMNEHRKYRFDGPKEGVITNFFNSSDSDNDEQA